MGKPGYKWDGFDWAVVIYVATHIPTTLLVDAQAIAPPDWHPAFAKEALAWHNTVNKDILMATLPTWFKGIVWVECTLQMAFFFAALYAWATRGNWIRIPTIVYGAHTATTLVPILAEFIGAPGLTDLEKAKLVAIYAPYLLMPLAMLWRAASRPGGMFTPGAAAASGSGGSKDGGRYYGNKDV